MIQRRRSSYSFGETLLWGIVLLCVAIELPLQLSDHGLLFGPGLRGRIYDSGAFWPGLLGDWQPNYPLQPELMFITYGFLHGGLAHLAFNMVTLLSLGRIVLRRAGTSGFTVIYFASMIFGAALYAVLSEGSQAMVGASGALFGLAGAILLWLWRAQPTLAASLRATWRIYAFLILYNVVMYYALAGGLAWQTHLGGFLAGWVVAWMFETRRR
ncbi:rhomboid family intramembrane serine protease [Tropicimonas sp. IMCC6043]|uniref:rhomboid family intramembrane serine protease n=1 Tax=Tropicimonas sp. IMCC6043 TaxID=2510645 RepID=UPI00101DCDB3|nr:rhomboid family intramembrane serine protease [Tropicimonas sp. IMCC6043]RYH09992.1 rhomboid family intramembrane serine protease [Tropicimonas sp. IMCC6043]